GECSLMLISLKAGGFGLNLTAADFVLHLDPWWNPAVEEQASARAIRIGQTKKVNVLRFISASTIEEEIVKMHEHKKDITEDLLKGTSKASKLSVEDLLKLLK
ncbi:MAG: SWF/SNF helicase family protein, partial [Lentisphaeraceae bacterium]|nr:SWF/SNF helicase family protein [Lentisphaeraceae bacterium]